MSGQSKKYGKAPVVQAVIDIRSDPPPGLTFADLRPLHDREKAGYPDLRDIVQIVQEFSLDESQETRRKTKVGYMFGSADGQRVVQTRTTGFTFSWLVPYDTWSVFREEALRLWKGYRKLAGPKSIQRVGVRYVNRLDLPQPVENLRRFLNLGPDAPAPLLAETEAFLIQLQSPQRDVGAKLILNAARVAPPKPEVVSIILDIDLFDERPRRSSANIGQRIDELHARVEEIFEQLITNETRALIA